MLRRDFLQAEIQKLAQVLARIIGLKTEGKLLEAENISKETLDKNFGLQWDILLSMPIEDFHNFLKSKNYPPEKLDILSQLLFENVLPLNNTVEIKVIFYKILEIFNLMEEEHHFQSLSNIERIKTITTFLNDNKE